MLPSFCMQTSVQNERISVKEMEIPAKDFTHIIQSGTLNEARMQGLLLPFTEPGRVLIHKK